MSGEGARVDRQKLLEIGGQCFGRAVRRTANLLTRTYNAFLAPVGIEVTQFSILCTIASAQAGSASELAEMVGVERSTLARNIDRLAAAGLVRAEAGEGRRVIHSLTAEGEERIAAALPLWQQAQDALQAELRREQSDMIREDFRSLRRAARAVRPAA
ncbi:MarR family winged helix-turn-helix transcriptional regulator [Mesorhizobium australicum]|uniref:DNA-binding transcriptional regulator, MarR family n=1 Tax=Mesorhizobium australicum TaxID=536018 RepID=A0A1X7PK38_9HYPH|nr:MarR family winged helix-turn-helix transcriptional regulator [Mesorhizobium australicum]SMH51474.1 DNA-binding transcriptional regulator, MarR family [Mesorhizobium australicum]